MEHPYAPIEAANGGGGAYAVFWRNGLPAALRLFAREELPVQSVAVTALAADLAGHQSGDETDRSMVAVNPHRAVSVVICTRDRPADLRRCLIAITTCVPAATEILVVDNAPSDDSTERVVRDFPAVSYLMEPAAGLSHARNCGVRAARGDIIAFTDDDTEVSPEWVARVSAPFDDPDVACVTGLVIPADLSQSAACLFEFTIGGFGKLLTRQRYDKAFLHQAWWRAPEIWKIGAGANMAIRRSAFAKVGLFDPRLGAGTSGCSEDSEFWYRLLRADQVCQYDPAAVVFHHHRADRAGLARQLRLYARGHVVALFIQFAQDRRLCHLIRVFLVMPLYYFKIWMAALVNGDREGTALVGPQVRGFLEAPFLALHLLRRDGPPKYSEDSA